MGVHSWGVVSAADDRRLVADIRMPPNCLPLPEGEGRGEGNNQELGEIRFAREP